MYIIQLDSAVFSHSKSVIVSSILCMYVGVGVSVALPAHVV